MSAATASDQPTADPVAQRAALYSDLADEYARLWSPVIRPMGERLLRELPIEGAARVLDVGTGVGALVPTIRAAEAAARIVGVDRALGMLRVARQAVAIPLAVMDAQRLALGTASFDVAVLAFMLFHLPDPRQGLAEVARVLRPGGAVGVTTWGEVPEFAASAVWDDVLKACGAGPDPLALADRDDLMDTPAKLGGLLEAAEFGEVRAWSERWEHRWDPEALIALRVGFGSYRRRLETLAPPVRTECVARVRARYAALRPEDFAYRPEVVFAVGRLAEAPVIGTS